MSVTEENRMIALKVREAFGGKPHVHKYWDENKKSSVDILSCEDNSFDGKLSYSTIGLSDYSIGYEDNSIPLRVELVGACDSEYFPNILATCAFNIINSKFNCSFGTIFLDVVKMYFNNGPMQHILFLTPFIWEYNLQTIKFENKEVAWLIAIPISEEERIFADRNGIGALQELFENNHINVFDLQRVSVI